MKLFFLCTILFLAYSRLNNTKIVKKYLAINPDTISRESVIPVLGKVTKSEKNPLFG